MYTADLLPQAYIYLLIQNWKVIYPAVTPLAIKFSRPDQWAGHPRVYSPVGRPLGLNGAVTRGV
jgi:hypothetical protein